MGVGAADENDGEEGIAHITEHMVFQSSPQYPQGLSDYLGRNGWQMGRHFNAQTGYDYTRYLFSPPQGSRQLEEVLKSTAKSCNRSSFPLPIGRRKGRSSSANGASSKTCKTA